MRFNIFIAFAVVVSLSSCSQRQALQKYINKNKVPLGYLSDSSRRSCMDKSRTVAISVSNNPLDWMSKVSVISRLGLPLIVYFYHDVNLFVELGQKSLEQPYNQFFRNKFSDESRRVGCYAVGDEGNDYTLDITFKSSHTTTKYDHEDHYIYVVFAILHTSSFRISPSNTLLKVSAVLKKKGAVVFENDYEIRQDQAFPTEKVLRRKWSIISKLESNMAENLSLTTKECIEDIVEDLNQFFRANP